MGPCGCPISSSAMRKCMASFALRNPAPVSASCAEDMTASMILQRMWTGALGVGSLESGVIGSLGLSLRK